MFRLIVGEFADALDRLLKFLLVLVAVEGHGRIHFCWSFQCPMAVTGPYSPFTEAALSAGEERPSMRV